MVDKVINEANWQDPLKVGLSLSQQAVPPEEPGAVWLLLTLTASKPDRPDAERRLPLNLGLVLDRSGSMAGAPLDYVKRATCRIVEQMDAEDLFSLTVFDDQVDLIRPAGPAADRDAIKAGVAQIREGGSTNLSGGLLRGGQEVRQHAEPGRVNRVLLLTDGRANVGMTDPRLLAAKARSMAEDGVSVSAVGVGRDFDEDLLLSLAESGKGNYYYLEIPDEIPAVLARELKGLLSVVAQNLRLTVQPGAGCGVVSVLGYEPFAGPEGLMLDLPDMYENETKTLILEIAHPALPAGEHEVLRFGFSYTDALGGLNQVDLSVTARLTAADGPPEDYAPDFTVVKVVELTWAALAKDKTIEAMDRGEVEEGRQYLRERIEALNKLNDAAPAPDEEIAAEVAELEHLVERIRGVADGVLGMFAMEPDLRKSMQYQSYQRRRNRRRR